MKKILNKINNLYRIRIVKWGIIPTFLLFIWIIFTFFTSADTSFTVLRNDYGKKYIVKGITKELLRGQIIAGKFQAIENNLGTIEVRFKDYGRKNNGAVSFRLKEVGNSKWYYQNIYQTSNFQGGKLYPFGFLPITNSKGKTYYFEVLSLDGKHGASIALDDTPPVFTVKYQFQKSNFTNTDELRSFILNKIKSSYLNYDFTSSSIYLLPAIFYILYQFYGSNKYFKKYIFVIYFFLIILFDAFFYINGRDKILFIVLLSWVILLKLKRYNPNFSLLVILLALFFSAILLLFNSQQAAIKVAEWVYLLLIINTVHSLVVFRLQSLTINKKEKNK